MKRKSILPITKVDICTGGRKKRELVLEFSYNKPLIGIQISEYKIGKNIWLFLYKWDTGSNHGAVISISIGRF